MERNAIEFREVPLFHKARFQTPHLMQGAIESFACFFYIVEGKMVGENEAIIKNCGNYVQHFLPSDTAEVFEAVVVYLYPDSLREI